MNLVRTRYVDHVTGKELVLEKEDDDLVLPFLIRLHEPLVGEVRYDYRGRIDTETEEEREEQ